VPERDLHELADRVAHAGRDDVVVRLDASLLRPAEVEHLIGNPEKARQKLGWEPTVDFTRLVQMMVDADLERLSRASRPLQRIAVP